jgi:hypothetical protein
LDILRVGNNELKELLSPDETNETKTRLGEICLMHLSTRLHSFRAHSLVSGAGIVRTTQRHGERSMGTTTLELLLKLHDDPHPWDGLWRTIDAEYGTEEHIADGGTFDDRRLATFQSMIEPRERADVQTFPRPR